jgi:CBS domain-containing protein
MFGPAAGVQERCCYAERSACFRLPLSRTLVAVCGSTPPELFRHLVVGIIGAIIALPVVIAWARHSVAAPKFRAVAAGIDSPRRWGYDFVKRVTMTVNNCGKNQQETPMKAGDIMTGRVVSTVPDAGVLEAIELMMRNHISGLPVIDSSGTLVGMVTEGDFLRRAETGTMRKRPRWLEFLVGPSRLAEEYVESHARKVEQVMTREPITITEDTPLDEVVLVMERRRIKRLPVMRGSQVVGIVSRANLMHALATLGRAAPPPSKSDAAIRKQLLAEFEKQFWAPAALIDVVVKNGVVELWGTILEGSQGEALKVCAENIPGVRSVVSRLTWVDTASGLVLGEPDQAAFADATKH